MQSTYCLKSHWMRNTLSITNIAVPLGEDVRGKRYTVYSKGLNFSSTIITIHTFVVKINGDGRVSNSKIFLVFLPPKSYNRFFLDLVQELNVGTADHTCLH